MQKKLPIKYELDMRRSVCINILLLLNVIKLRTYYDRIEIFNFRNFEIMKNFSEQKFKWPNVLAN